MAETSDLILFFGRFHPLLVHLPIGFLLLAFLFEICSRYNRFENLGDAVPFTLLLGSISALTAAGTGYLLSWDGGYGDELLSWHMWLGISVILLSLSAFILRQWFYEKSHFRKMYTFLLWIMVFCLMGAGHYGGSLTHGSDYLVRYMPEPLRSVAGLPAVEEKGIKPIKNLDSARVFMDVIHPILDTRCVSCHNPEKKKGELLLTSYEEMMQGGENGPVVKARNADESDLVKRILLPERHDDRMPPSGKQQLTDDQKDLISWWIEQGLPNTETVSELEVPKEMAAVLENLTVDGQSFFERVQIPPADEELVENLRNEGFLISPIAEGVPFLQVSLSKSITSLHAEKFEKLLSLSEQITWMDLSHTDVSDSDLRGLSDFRHLTRLSLQHTSITDSTLAWIGSLKNLEYVNLYGTQITDRGMQHLDSLSALKNLYLWQTNVSGEAIEHLKGKLTEVNVDTGIHSGNDTMDQKLK